MTHADPLENVARAIQGEWLADCVADMPMKERDEDYAKYRDIYLRMAYAAKSELEILGFKK